VQLSILRSLALVAVGNAALKGDDVSAFWPGGDLFKYSKQTEFVVQRGDRYEQAAPDPLAWFEKLKSLGCRGLRLHRAPMQQRAGIGPQKERMLVGMVGGGPRWLVETVMPARREVWEGYDRLGHKDDPQEQIWLSAYVLVGEVESGEVVEGDVAAATADLRGALTDIEVFARSLPDAPFADFFASAQKALDGAKGAEPDMAFVALTRLSEDAKRLLRAVQGAWVFAGMGSWNDLGVDKTHEARYEATSEALFLSLQRAVLAIANSTYAA
jgi:hypothetical protein